MIAALKAAHIAALTIWCAGLVLLPILMHLQGRGAAMLGQSEFSRFRWLTHYSYTRVISPAAVVAVTAGTVLIFALGVLDVWMMTKLVAVTGMVALHAWLGHLINQAGEQRRQYRMPPVGLALLGIVPLILVVLWLVLAKPDMEALLALFPEFLQQPRDREIPGGWSPI